MDLSIAINNLTSVAVLVFILGFIGARFKSDLRIPESIYQLISIYLLLGIGLKGGHALKDVSFQEIIKPSLVTLIVGSLIPFLVFYVLKTIKYLSVSQRGALAAHYGSTSLVTFSAAVLYLENNSIFFEGYSTALLTIMEVPGLVVGIYLASRKYQILRHHEEAPQMPTGYPGMVILSLFPPLWFAIMNRRIDRYHQQHQLMMSEPK